MKEMLINGIPQGMQYFLDWYSTVISNAIIENIPTNAKWIYHKSNKSTNSNIIVSPLLQHNGQYVSWNQSGNSSIGSLIEKSYNKFCPAVHTTNQNCEHALVGCVAVAMAQIMWYWQWPYVSIVNDDNDNSILRLYDWESMPYKLFNTTETYNVDMVANLLHDCGVALNMEYGCPGIGSSSSTSYGRQVLRDSYEYASTMQKVSRVNYTYADWCNILRNELDMLRPIWYAGYKTTGGGHSFVIDGYDDTEHFHVNIGWGGSSNGYYLLDSINLSNPYSNGQYAIIGIKPQPVCDSLFISDTIFNDNFIYVSKEPINIENVVIEPNVKGVVISEQSIILRPNTNIELGADVLLDIKNVKCE